MDLKHSEKSWDHVIEVLRDAASKAETPSINILADRKSTPFQILISTLISLRTRDPVTIASSQRLFERAPDPGSVIQLETAEIADLIYPAGFYKTKALNIKRISGILLDRYRGLVPEDFEELLKLPGVGRKTANLTLGLSYGIPAICVDTHVHRIPNRMGWISTKTPEETEASLAEMLPRRYWIEINELMVAFGQTICTPVSPRCSKCPFSDSCTRAGVSSTR